MLRPRRVTRLTSCCGGSASHEGFGVPADGALHPPVFIGYRPIAVGADAGAEEDLVCAALLRLLEGVLGFAGLLCGYPNAFLPFFLLHRGADGEEHVGGVGAGPDGFLDGPRAARGRDVLEVDEGSFVNSSLGILVPEDVIPEQEVEALDADEDIDQLGAVGEDELLESLVFVGRSELVESPESPGDGDELAQELGGGHVVPVRVFPRRHVRGFTVVVEEPEGLLEHLAVHEPAGPRGVGTVARAVHVREHVVAEKLPSLLCHLPLPVPTVVVVITLTPVVGVGVVALRFEVAAVVVAVGEFQEEEDGRLVGVLHAEDAVQVAEERGENRHGLAGDELLPGRTPIVPALEDGLDVVEVF